MSEFLLELYSEEMPPQLQISARKELKENLKKLLEEESVKYSAIFSYSSPTRLTILVKNLEDKIKIPSKEIKGPKVGVSENILASFIKSRKVNKSDVFEKEINKVKFYFIRTKAKETFAKDLIIKIMTLIYIIIIVVIMFFKS